MILYDEPDSGRHPGLSSRINSKRLWPSARRAGARRSESGTPQKPGGPRVFEAGSGIRPDLVVRVSRRLPGLTLGGTSAKCRSAIFLDRAPNLRDRHGSVHGGAFLRERRILFNCTQAEFPRIFTHEVFHFVWVRLGNSTRQAFERCIAREIAGRAGGELGWAAESRKLKLTRADRAVRSRHWREYCCEAFCDTAAWLYSGVEKHPEFTLARSWRGCRRRWFETEIGSRVLSI